jgi:hypothetical protein
MMFPLLCLAQQDRIRFLHLCHESVLLHHLAAIVGGSFSFDEAALVSAALKVIPGKFPHTGADADLEIVQAHVQVAFLNFVED